MRLDGQMPDYDYHVWSRHTPNTDDDYESDDPGIIAVLDGRLGYSNSAVDEEDDDEGICKMIHDRRNVRSLSNAPDPYFKRRSL